MRKSSLSWLRLWNTEAEPELECTTILLEDSYKPPAHLLRAKRIILNESELMMITTTDKDGKKTITAVV